MFEFDLGNTFNYVDMATLIAPRPFMVERGHFDPWPRTNRSPPNLPRSGFSTKRSSSCRTAAGSNGSTGPHTIHGQGTFDFLHQHLGWPKPIDGR